MNWIKENAAKVKTEGERKGKKKFWCEEKQLYWIRIIGIPFLFAAIGIFLSLLISASNGRR